MIESLYITANKIMQHLLVTGSGREVVLFVHGNGSDSVFWKSLMRKLPDNFTSLGPDSSIEHRAILFWLIQKILTSHRAATPVLRLC